MSTTDDGVRTPNSQDEEAIARLRLTLRSVTTSAWQADTFFGHLCWALVRREGEEALRAFLSLYDQGQPPLVLSNGFPGDLLPRPILPPLPSNSALPIADRIRQARMNKDAAQVGYLSLEEFNRVRQGERTTPKPKAGMQHRVTMKNQISRLTGTTGEEGQLYPQEESYASPDDRGQSRVTFYLRITPEFLGLFRALVEQVVEEGYGKRKTVGYGEIADWKLEPFEGFEQIIEADGFVSLSNFVPARDDPRDGYWQMLVKYGKLGEELATSDNPFKRPLVMLAAGSCFHHAPVRPWYGRLVHKISPAHPKVVQYGLAFALPIRFPPVN
jgi:CRISPR-associated protein Csm4